jgi:hypothetical protein
MHRIPLIVTAGVAALAFAAAPAFAGSDGCSGDDCIAENAPPPVVPVGPLPVADQPLPEVSPVRQHATRRTRHRVRAVTVSAPRGAVAAGAGGTAETTSDDLLALLAGGALVLTAAGGGLIAARRRS